MKLACTRAAWLLQQRAAGLSTASGLFVEEHLEGCPECQQSANLLDGLQHLHARSHTPLETGQRERAITRALQTRERSATTALTRPPLAATVRWGAAGLFAAAACAAWYVSRELPTAKPAPATLAASVHSDTGDRVEAGRLERAGVELQAGAAFAGSDTWHTREGARLALAHGRVAVAPGSSIHWDARSRELQLVAGSVFIDVDPARHESFGVRTPDFSVAVLGTRFHVSLYGVTVERGRVRVSSRAGEQFAVLEAGSQWHWQPPRASAQQVALPQPAAADPVQRQATPRTASASARAPAQAPDAEVSRARERLGLRDVATARQILARVLLQSLTPELRAEALSLAAECELVEGKHQAARAAYLAVARRYPHAMAGQVAFFAAARIEAEHGDRQRAAVYFARYLRLYPTGRFASEAQKRLHMLRPGPAP